MERIKHGNQAIKRLSKKLDITNSAQNIFSPPSTVSSQILLQDEKTCSILNQERIITELVDKIFDAKRGIYEASSSYCSSLSRQSSEYSFDKRLLYWKNVVRDRKLLSKNIGQQIGKRENDMLFNRPVTIDDRDKNTVKRVLDYADRMDPETLSTLKLFNLKNQCEKNPEIYATLPKPERDGGTAVEISGMPKVTIEEQMGLERKEGKKNIWFDSEVLKEHIFEKRTDIERVVEFYPDIENLQIVGENLAKKTSYKRNPDVIIDHEDINVVSSESQSTEECVIETKIETFEEPIPQYGLRINDEIFKFNEKRSSKLVEFEFNFLCEPFDYVAKRILRLKNIGKKILSFQFHRHAYFDKSPQLLKPLDNEFCFNHYPFRLLCMETREIIIQYQPRKVGVFKEKWLLKTDTKLFCSKTDSIIIMLSGKCKPSQEYVDHLDSIMTSVLYKSNLHMMRTLTTGLSSLTPMLEPDEVICPYKRALTEMEVFVTLNVGYKCDRFHDLELLKDIYKRIKKPRDNAWDLKLVTLKEKILQIEPVETRALIFSEMLAVLEDMKATHMGGKFNEDDIEPPNEERDRAKFVFVRGILTTGIDEWEENAYNIEEAFLNSLELEYEEKLQQQLLLDEEKSKKSFAGGEGVPSNRHSSKSSGRLSIRSTGKKQKLERGDTENATRLRSSRIGTYFMTNDDIRRNLKEQVKRRKYFRDTLYMQTYSHLCDVMENIVSVIESTEII